MAVTLWVGSLYLPYILAVLLAIIVRLLVTGALHEDGLADFCDGFGGGSTGLPEKDRERTLRIMKDSFIGTYGVLGLILYFLLLWNILYSLSDLLPLWKMVICMIVVDVFSKFMSSMIVYFLPYARDAENAKNKIVYNR